MNKIQTKPEDTIIICIDCGDRFTFSNGERRYFDSKQLSIPKRCPGCRVKRKTSLVPEVKRECSNCYHLLPTKLCAVLEISDMEASGFCNDWREGNSNDNYSK